MAKITYKIDRLISNNNTLELGLKTNVALSITTAATAQDKPTLKSSAILSYSDDMTNYLNVGFTSFVLNDHIFKNNNNLIPNVGFVKAYAENETARVYSHLYNAYLAAASGGHISVDKNINNSGASNPLIELSVTPLYSGAETDNEGHHTVGDIANTANMFITGFTTDNYGKIISVQARQVATSDLNVDAGAVDNYRSWTISDNVTTAQILSSYAKATDTSLPNSPRAPLVFTATAPISNTLSSNGTTHTITTSLSYDSTHFATNQGGSLTLATVSGVETTASGGATPSPEFVKVKIDAYGRVTGKEAVDGTSLKTLIGAFSSSNDGYVTHLQEGTNTTTATPGSTYFLTSGNTWAKFQYDRVSVTRVSSGDTQYPLLGATDNSGANAIDNTSTLHRAVANTSAYITGAGVIHGTFAGNGSAITNLSVANITNNNSQSLIQPVILQLEDASSSNKNGLFTALGLNDIRDDDPNTAGNKIYLPNRVVITNSSGKLATTTLAVDGGSGISEGTAILSANFTNGQISNTSTIQWSNIKTLVTGIVAGEGGMRFMGVIGSSSSNQIPWGTVESSFKKGDFYKIGAIVDNPDTNGLAWDYGGYKNELEVGDTIIAVMDKGDNYPASADGRKAYWSVIQGNLKNAVTMSLGNPADNSVYNLALSSQNNGTIDSVVWRGINVTAHVNGNNRTYDIDANASSSDKLSSSVTLWGQTFDGSDSVSGDLTGVQNITPYADNTYSLGTATIGNNGAISNKVAFKDAWINDIYGDLHGNATTATTADKVAHQLKVWLGPKTGANDVENTPNVVFDGSADTDLIINVDSLNIFDHIGTKSVVGYGTDNATIGNVITDITLSRDSSDKSTLNYEITKGLTVVENISSSIFAIGDGSNNTKTISFKQTLDGGVLGFYTGGNAPLRKSGTYNYSDTDASQNNNGTLRLAGNLEVVNMKVAVDSNTQKLVAHETNAHPTSNPDYGKEVLVVTSNSGDYSFTSSGITISNNTLTSSTTVVPTAQSVVNYVTGVQNDINASSKMDVIGMSFGVGSGEQTVNGHSIPIKAIIDHIDICITTSFSSQIVFNLTGYNNQKLVSSESTGNPDNLIDISDENGTVYTYKYSKASGSANGTFTPQITVSSIPESAAGAGKCYIYYTSEPR